MPRRLATSPAWCALTDPVARVVLRGVRTRGSAGNGRREWYGATDTRAVTAVAGAFDGVRPRHRRPVDPPCRFGFSSTPRRPSVTAVVTTVQVVSTVEDVESASGPRQRSMARLTQVEVTTIPARS